MCESHDVCFQAVKQKLSVEVEGACQSLKLCGSSDGSDGVLVSHYLLD